MHRRTIWRLTISDRAASPPQLTAAIRTHLAHASLTTALVQIGDAQRAYLALDGCDGCRAGRCRPGCRADLLRRALRAVSGAELLPSDGLAARPYARATYAVPGRGVHPLTSELLAPWREARLALHWPRDARGASTCAALLLTSADGPHPTDVLRSQGWCALPLPQRLHRALAPAAPSALPIVRGWDGVPALLVPAAAQEPMETDDEVNAPDLAPMSAAQDDILTDWLHQTMADPERTLRAAQAAPPTQAASAGDAPDDRWPAGPAGIPPAILGELMAQLLAEPSFDAPRPGQRGLTKGRLVGLRHSFLTEPASRALMVWLDRAGALEAPPAGQSPWRAPRPFAIRDVDALAARLRETPPPTDDDVRAAYGGHQ